MTAKLEATLVRQNILGILDVRGYPMTVADIEREEFFRLNTDNGALGRGQVRDELVTLERLGFVSAEAARAAGFTGDTLAWELTAAGEAQIKCGMGARRHPAVWGRAAI